MAAARNPTSRSRQAEAAPGPLTITELAELLTAAGLGAVPREWIEADIASGAPTNEDGTLNLLDYAAWLVVQLKPEGPG